MTKKHSEVKTIYDIAKMANVSASTVSRVINNKPGIGEKTRERIQLLLEEYSYMPNQIARNLVYRSSRTIGIMLCDITSVHHAIAAHIINQELMDKGYYSILVNTETDKKNLADSFKRILQKQVDGVILVGSPFQSPEMREIILDHAENLPIAIINGQIELPNVLNIVVDEKSGVTEIVGFFHEQERKHPLFVLDKVTPSNLLKQKGYEEGMRRFYPQQNPSVFYFNKEKNDSEAETQRLLQTFPETDAIIFCIDLLAAQALRAIRSAGRSIPKDIGVVGIDNSIYSEISYPRLSSLDNRILDLSKLAADLLIENITNRKPFQNLLIQPQFIIREST